MTGQVLLDAGPLVAYLDRHDRFHRWALDRFKEVRPPLVTCEPVLTEALFLLRSMRGYGRKVIELLERGAVAVAFDVQTELVAIGQLIERFEDVPISLADACLIRMAELNEFSRILTLDSDFRIYRKNRRQMIPVIMPEL